MVWGGGAVSIDSTWLQRKKMSDSAPALQLIKHDKHTTVIAAAISHAPAYSSAERGGLRRINEIACPVLNQPKALDLKF